jgi:hypothetical protein
VIEVPWDDLLKMSNEEAHAWFAEAKRGRGKAILAAAYELYDAHTEGDEADQEEKLLTLLIRCEEADKLGDWLDKQAQEFFERRKENRRRALQVRRETLAEERQKREEWAFRGLTAAQIKAIRKAHPNTEDAPPIPVRETRDERIRNDQLRSNGGFVSLRNGTPPRKDRLERSVE